MLKGVRARFKELFGISPSSAVSRPRLIEKEEEQRPWLWGTTLAAEMAAFGGDSAPSAMGTTLVAARTGSTGAEGSWWGKI